MVVTKYHPVLSLFSKCCECSIKRKKVVSRYSKRQVAEPQKNHHSQKLPTSTKSLKTSLKEEAKQVKGVTEPTEKPDWCQEFEKTLWRRPILSWLSFLTGWWWILFFPSSGTVCLPRCRNKGDIWWQSCTCTIARIKYLWINTFIAICSLMFNERGNQGNPRMFCFLVFFPKAMRGT